MNVLPIAERVEALEQFVTAYIVAMLWSSNEGDTPLDVLFNLNSVTGEDLSRITNECGDFIDNYGHLLDGRWELAGHDFWMTRAGHGCGFWDGDWSEHGDELTEACKKYDNCEPYVGDDGKLYFSWGKTVEQRQAEEAGRKFYKTLIQVEVLSEKPLEWDTLGDVNYAITQGECSGKVTEVSSETLTGKQAADALIEHGSDPGFFQLTAEGADDLV